jgi:LysR family malonate utilization transcriptional regulator
MKFRIDEEITLRKLEMLLAFLKSGSLARTAEQLELTPVSVHRALHSLENGLRCQLFRHEGRQLVPLPAAFVLGEVAQEAVEAVARGVSATREAAGFSADRLRLGSLYSLTTRVVPRMIMEVKLRRPELQIDLVLGSNSDLLERLGASQVDAAIMGQPGADSDLQTLPLFQDELFFAVPAGDPCLERAEIDLKDFAGAAFVSLREGYITTQSFDDLFRIAGFAPRVATRVGDIYSLMNLVAGGVGYTLLPGRVRNVMGDRVKLLPLAPPYALRQAICFAFLKVRERDPNILALASVCRVLAREFRG